MELTKNAKPTSLRLLTQAAADLAEAQAALESNVLNAIRCGASWTEIGAILGVSKQTAHARYGKTKTAPASKISDTEVAGDSVTPSIFSDAPAPAKSEVTMITGVSVGPPHVEEWTDPRPEFVLRSAGMIDGVAQPGTGKGPHQCPRCGSNNHKSGKPNTIRAYLDCPPTKYDPQDIADHLNRTGLSKKAGTK